MKRRFMSFVISAIFLCGISNISIISVKASNNEFKKVDGSYLTMEDSSRGITSEKSVTRGKHMMTGECSISKAGTKRIYAFGATTANHEVDSLAVIVYVDQYNEENDEWWQIDWFMENDKNDYFVYASKSIVVERGYYYRVRANHLAGDQAPYDETASATDGILLP